MGASCKTITISFSQRDSRVIYSLRIFSISHISGGWIFGGYLQQLKHKVTFMQELKQQRCLLLCLLFWFVGYMALQQEYTNWNFMAHDHGIPIRGAHLDNNNNTTLTSTTTPENTTWNVVETVTHTGGIQYSTAPSNSSAPRRKTHEGADRYETPSPTTKPTGKPRFPNIPRILVVGYYRSGSSFLAQLLSSNPSTFFHFEPLHMFSRNERVPTRNLSSACDVITSLFLCNFEKFPEYINDVKKNKWILSHNQLWRRHCLLKGGNCTDPRFLSAVCANASTQVMKLVRLGIGHIHDWLKYFDQISGTLKIVHLVRDPRGILASRRAISFCTNSTLCSNPGALCQEMAGDLEAFRRIEKDFPESSLRVRYEDIALEPFKQTKLLFIKLGLQFSDLTTVFLRQHTQNGTTQEVADPFSTKRNSTENAFLWKKRLNTTEIQNIEMQCRGVLRELGYKEQVATPEQD